MTTILLCFFSPITKTDISTSEYSSAYLYTNFKHFMLTLYYCLEEPVAAAPLFCDQLVITTVTHFTFVFARIPSLMKACRFEFGKIIRKRGARLHHGVEQGLQKHLKLSFTFNGQFNGNCSLLNAGFKFHALTGGIFVLPCFRLK